MYNQIPSYGIPWYAFGYTSKSAYEVALERYQWLYEQICEGCEWY